MHSITIAGFFSLYLILRSHYRMLNAKCEVTLQDVLHMNEDERAQLILFFSFSLYSLVMIPLSLLFE